LARLDANASVADLRRWPVPENLDDAANNGAV
jgi:hypothetical protein